MRAAMRNGLYALAGIAFALLAGFVMFAGQVSRYSTEAAAPQGVVGDDAVVVLTGGSSRVKEGLRLFEAVQARRILISGVHKQTTREQLRRKTGLPDALFACCVDIGYAAQDTSGNAAEALAWADAWGFKRLRIVTSNYHMPRSLMELQHKLPHIVLVPHPVLSPTYDRVAWWTNADALRIVAIEYVKTLPVVARIGMSRMIAWASGGEPPRGPATSPTRERLSLMP